MNHPAEKPIWTPTPQRINDSGISKFTRYIENTVGAEFDNYDALHDFSIHNQAAFWQCLWDYCGVRGENTGPVLTHGDQMPGARYFPESRFNFAENLLVRQGSDDAMVFWGEDKIKMRLSWDQLHRQVSRLQQAFKSFGITKGDRIAAMVPNRPESIVAMLAASSLGAIWSSCSPDFGEQGVLDRFLQIEPELFIACDGYWYNGKPIDVGDKVAAISQQLQSKNSLIISYLGKADALAERIENCHLFDDVINQFDATSVEFAKLPFDHPLYILFSSGTTGIPKCIVHSQGGILLQHLKEHQLHCDIQEGDRVFYFTTCGWMMWNWLATVLASGATVMLYDGSPFAPDGNILFDYAEQEKFTLFGTSAKFIDALRNSGLSPKDSHDLSRIKTITSTGSPLADENFRFVYASIKPDIHLASMSGGTDLAGCLVLGIPTKPVFLGEIQGPGLAMAIDVWDDEGHPLRQEKGELVCTKPFPSMPIGFWNDTDGKKYHEAYFDQFDNIWCHGDFAEWTANGGMIIHGRSDATLNPGGVRIGTAEIYNQVEQLDEIDEALCIGQKWSGGQGDVRIVLFVVMAKGVTLDEAIITKIKNKIRVGASPRHVPAIIISVADIPRTKSGKITELAVREIVHGREVKNKEALANPEALELFRNLPDLGSGPIN